MGIDTTFPVAFAKSQAGAYGGLPTSGSVFISVSDDDKSGMIFPVSQLVDMGFRVYATSGTSRVLSRYGIESTHVDKISDQPDHNVVHLISSRQIDMVINTPNNKDSRADGYSIRAATTAADLPIMTTIAEFGAAVLAIKHQREHAFEVVTLQEHNIRK